MHDRLNGVSSIKITDLAWTLQQTALNANAFCRQGTIYFNGQRINGNITWDYDNGCWNLD